MSVFIPILKKGNTKEGSNYCTIGLILHASKVMLKNLQGRFHQYVNHEFTDVQAGFRITSLSPMQDTACLVLVHGDDPEGCCWEGGGMGVHVWDRMYTRGGFMSMYGKTNTVL